MKPRRTKSFGTHVHNTSNNTSTKLQLQRIKLHIEIVNLKPVTPTTILLRQRMRDARAWHRQEKKRVLYLNMYTVSASGQIHSGLLVVYFQSRQQFLNLSIYLNIEAWWFFRTNRNSPEFNRNSCRNIRWYFLPKFRITEIQNYRNSRNSRVPVCAKKFTVVEHHVNTLVIGNLCYLLHFHINHFNQTHGVDKPSLGSHNVTASTKTQNTAKSPLLYYQRGTFSISYT